MENIRNLQIHVDLLYGALPVSQNLKQGDTTRLTLTVFRGGKSYPLESLTPILNAKRADKLIYIQTSDYDVNDNSITYNLAPQIVAELGRLQLEIELDDADGNIISSFTIGITVEPRLFNGEEDVAPDDQNEIIDAAREAALPVAQARDAAQTAVDARDTAVQTINTSRDNAVANVNKAADKRIEEINAMSVKGTVRFDEAQGLTDAQMTQARANVGAASAAEVDKLSDENANLKGDLANVQSTIAAKMDSYTIKTVMDSVATPHTQYYLGNQTAVDIVLPDTANVGQIITVCWYNGDTAATLSITGTMLDFDYTPDANSRSEINALWDGVNWAVLGNEMAVF